MRPNAEGLSNTDGMRRMIRTWVGMPEPVPLRDTALARTGLLPPVSRRSASR